MPKRLWIIAVVPFIMLGFAWVSLPLSSVQAIAEVTPTPMPEPDSGEMDVEQLLTEAWNDLENEDFEFMIDSTTRVIEVEADNAEAYFLRSIANRRLGHLPTALDDMSVAIDLVPETYHPIRAVTFPLSKWLLYTLRGDIHFEMGNTGEALFDYDEAIALYPLVDNISAFESRAALNYQLGDTKAGDVDDSIALGLERMGSGDTSAAIDFFSDAIASGQMTPSVGIAYYDRGAVFQGLGDEAAAIEDWTRAIEINPEMHIAYLARGISYREAGDIQAAGDDFYQRMTLLGTDFVEQATTVGDTFEIEMDYRRVVSIQFEGAAGDLITIAARETGDRSTDPLIALLDPAKTPIAGDDDFGGNLDSLIENFELPETGTYTLYVGHAEGAYGYGFEGLIEVSIKRSNVNEG